MGLGGGAGREGRASVPSTPDPTSSPKSPLQGSGKEGVGPAPAPDGVQLALGGAPRFPRGPQTQAGLTHGARDLGVVHPAPHITQRVGGQATEAAVLPRGTRQVSPQLPALRGGASGSPGGGGEGPSGRDLGSSGVFIRLKHPQGADCGGGGQRGEGSRPEQTFQASRRFWAGLMGTEEGSTVPRGTPKGTPAPHFALYQTGSCQACSKDAAP